MFSVSVAESDAFEALASGGYVGEDASNFTLFVDDASLSLGDGVVGSVEGSVSVLLSDAGHLSYDVSVLDGNGSSAVSSNSSTTWTSLSDSSVRLSLGHSTSVSSDGLSVDLSSGLSYGDHVFSVSVAESDAFEALASGGYSYATADWFYALDNASAVIGGSGGGSARLLIGGTEHSLRCLSGLASADGGEVASGVFNAHTEGSFSDG